MTKRSYNSFSFSSSWAINTKTSWPSSLSLFIVAELKSFWIDFCKSADGMKKSDRFVFYNKTEIFSVRALRCKSIASFSWPILSSTKALNQSPRENSDSTVIIKFSFDNFATENKVNSSIIFLVIVKSESFFMVCTLIDHRNDAIKCSKLGSRTQVPSFEHFMTPFLWYIRVQTMKKSGRFVKFPI